jgi:hypothetical protein
VSAWQKTKGFAGFVPGTDLSEVLLGAAYSCAFEGAHMTL